VEVHSAWRWGKAGSYHITGKRFDCLHTIRAPVFDNANH
jgi:hypothetical protein